VSTSADLNHHPVGAVDNAWHAGLLLKRLHLRSNANGYWLLRTLLDCLKLLGIVGLWVFDLVWKRGCAECAT